MEKSFYKKNTCFSTFKSRACSLPFIRTVMSHLVYYPVPVNLNYGWGFGSLLGVLLGIQIVTGLFLAVHYVPDIMLAFYSVEFIMREVSGGWFIRYLHSTGASLIFMVLYAHLLRGLYYRSFKNSSMVYRAGFIYLNDGYCLFRLCLSMRANEFMGGDCYYESFWYSTYYRGFFGYRVMRWLCYRSSYFKEVFYIAFSSSFYNSIDQFYTCFLFTSGWFY